MNLKPLIEIELNAILTTDKKNYPLNIIIGEEHGAFTT
jgi:hypothetical protein